LSTELISSRSPVIVRWPLPPTVGLLPSGDWGFLTLSAPPCGARSVRAEDPSVISRIERRLPIVMLAQHLQSIVVGV
jgi:hypothetical protein